MKKKLYLQPAIEVIDIRPFDLLRTSPGWAKDGNPPIEVEKESDDPEDWDEFFDLD